MTGNGSDSELDPVPCFRCCIAKQPLHALLVNTFVNHYLEFRRSLHLVLR